MRDPALGRARARVTMSKKGETEAEEEDGATEEDVESEGRGVLRMAQETKTKENEQPDQQEQQPDEEAEKEEAQLSVRKKDLRDGRVVDVVLSDMSAPWEQTTGHWIRSVSNPYFRMMNTSGTAFRDHAGSMVSFSAFSNLLLSFFSPSSQTHNSRFLPLSRTHWLKRWPFSTGRISAMLP